MCHNTGTVPIQVQPAHMRLVLGPSTSPPFALSWPTPRPPTRLPLPPQTPPPPLSPSLSLYTSRCSLDGLQGACRGQPAVGCVLCARHGGAPRCSDVHGECCAAEQFQPAASQPTGPRGPPHHQDPHLLLQVLFDSMPLFVSLPRSILAMTMSHIATCDYIDRIAMQCFLIGHTDDIHRWLHSMPCISLNTIALFVAHPLTIALVSKSY